MLFGEMWLKIQKTTILAWFAREASNLEVKLDLKRGFNNWYFERNFCFAVPVIKATKSKNCEKKASLRGCHLRNVFMPYLNFSEITDLQRCFEFYENSVFEILFLKKTSRK